MPSVTTLDLSTVPEALEGMWVVFRASDQIALGHGHTPREAMDDAKVLADDSNILLARIPAGTLHS